VISAPSQAESSPVGAHAEAGSPRNAGAAGARASTSTSTVRQIVVAAGQRYALLVVFAAIIVLFSVLNPAIFPTTSNAQTIASTQATVALLALAAMLPLIVGQFDISIGYQFGFAQGLCAYLIIDKHLAAGGAVGVVVLAGLTIGLVNGLLVARMKLNSFVATLGVGILVLGLTEMLTKDVTIAGPLPSAFTALGRNSLAGVPLPFVYVVVACAVLWIGLEYTAWGRSWYATGGNERAALLAGIRTRRVTVSAFVLAALLAAVSGCLSVMILGASSPTVGLGSLLPAFAGAFLGATSIRPGRFNAVGTLIAVYLVATGITGLQQEGASSYVQDVFNGAALLIAVALARLATVRRRGA
jgi:ribose transport system permease protein